MLENFFLTYANNHFCCDLGGKNTDKIFSEILPDLYDAFRLKPCFDLMKKFASWSYTEPLAMRYERALHLRDELKKSDPYFKQVPPLVDYSFHAVHGYHQENCEDCYWNPGKMAYFDLKFVLDFYAYPEGYPLMCHECRQFMFVCILFQAIALRPGIEHIGAYRKKITEQQECKMYKCTPGDTVTLNNLPNLLQDAYSVQRCGAVVTDGKIVKKPFIKSDIFFTEGDNHGLFSLNNFIFSAALYSLFEFIIKHGREKIFLCEICGRFATKKTNREKKFCSDECRYMYHNKKKIQSGKMKEYLKDKRSKGAPPSYYGSDPQKVTRKTGIKS